MNKPSVISLTKLNLPTDSMFILEKLSGDVKVTNSNGDIFLEGIAAVFGIMNENNRIYEKQEYLPHLSYLNEKINSRQLFGELDHPQKFDVSLANVSHVVEKLAYDEGSNTVRIKLRLLDTPCGRIAKTLTEAGCKLSISSRAAGNVSESGKVKLHKIFTYDLVAEGGFKEAGLEQVAESLKGNYTMLFESLESLKTNSIVNTLEDISENFKFGESVKIYRINNPESSTPQNNTTKMANEFVTKQEMNQYSEVMKKKFNTLQESISKNADGLKQGLKLINENMVNESPNFGKLVQFTNYLAEQMEQVIGYTNYLSTMVNQGIGYTEHVAEKVNNVIDFSDYVAEKLEKSIYYSNYLGERLNQSINYQEFVVENIEKTVKYANYLAEKLDQGINYTESVANHTDRSIQFANYLSENLEAAIKYSNYLGKNLTKGIKYSEYIAETLNDKVTPSSIAKSRKLLGEIKKLNEGKEIGQINENSTIDDLVSTVDGMLSHIQSTTAKAVLENKYTFLKLLSEPRKNAFYNLDQPTKTAIVETLRGAVYFNEDEVVNLMEAVLNKQVENTPSYIKFMPVSYKEIYEGMNDNERNWVSAKASTFALNTPYQVKTFWDSCDFRGIRERIAQSAVINNSDQSINESQSKEGFVSLAKVQEVNRGYSTAYLESLKRKATN